MPDTSPIVRQWQLLNALSNRREGVTVRAMADEHSVSQKTVRRDLLLLRRIGLPLEEAEEDYGRKVWKITEPHTRPPLGFTLTEALALYLGRRFLEPLAGTHFWEGANSAFAKIRAALGDPVLKYLGKVASVVHPTRWPAGDYSRHAELIDALMVGVEDRKTTFIEYQSARATEPVSIELNPYGIVWHRGSVYLVADSRDHGELRHFKIDRISAVDVTKLPFQRPKDFDLARHVEQSFGILHGEGPARRVRILFDNEVALYVSEKSFHPSQQLTKQSDGRMIAEFEVGDLRELKAWVLSFGRHAQVLEPAELVEEMRGELAALVAIYTADRVAVTKPVPTTPRPQNPAGGRKPRRKPK